MLARAGVLRSGCFELAACWEWSRVWKSPLFFFFANWRNSTAVTHFLQHFSYFQICQRLTSESVALNLRPILVSISAERKHPNVRFCLGRPKPCCCLDVQATSKCVWLQLQRTSDVSAWGVMRRNNFNNLLLCFFSLTTLQARCPGMLEIRGNNGEISPSCRRKETYIHVSCAEIMCLF